MVEGVASLVRLRSILVVGEVESLDEGLAKVLRKDWLRPPVYFDTDASRFADINRISSNL